MSRPLPLLLAFAALAGFPCAAPLSDAIAGKDPTTTYFFHGKAKIKSTVIGDDKVVFTVRVDVTGSRFEMRPPRSESVRGNVTALDGGKLLLEPDEDQPEELAEFVSQLNMDAHATTSEPGLGEPPVTDAVFTISGREGKETFTMDVSFAPVMTGQGDPTSAVLDATAKRIQPSVVILDDDFSGAQMLAALAKKRIKAVDLGYFQNWDGITPSLGSTRVVIFCQGYDYGIELSSEADAALVQFVQNGGLLIRNTWSAYEAGSDPSYAVDGLNPFVSPDSEYDYGSSWRTAAAHPITKSVKPFVLPEQGYETGFVAEGAQVLMTLDDPNNDDGPVDDAPALILGEVGNGAVLYVNNDLTYSEEIIHPSILKIYQNAVKWGLKRPQGD
ncbi:MAG: hypothetical protein HMLKMBBP_03967 [Planctomycetes bacterium]|nr:hypothetical protein [Planctomycetota bacterium]